MKTVEARGVTVPTFIYGTAWKEDETARLVRQALEVGFVGIDTANQRRHYFEAAVGEALREAFAQGLVQRDELFVQTKFTFRDGQDHRLPYDADAPIATQVAQSFASSLEHLGLSVLDSYVLHGPSTRGKLATADWEAWAAMERLHAADKTRLLGVSNVSAPQLAELCERAAVKPAMVQNRCFASRGWDAEVRRVCDEHGVVYQAFSLLTANRHVLEHPRVQALAKEHGRTPAQLVFRYALELGMIALTGSSSREHLAQDLECYDFELTEEERAAIAAA